MNRHYRQGFQRTFLNDIYHVEERLQEYDPYLSLLYNPKTNGWLICDELMGVAVMSIPQKGFETLDGRVVEHMKKIHTANGFSAVKQIEASDARREREYKRKQNDLIDDMAREMLPAARELNSTGRVEGVKTYY